jgi:hypothetical protein
MADIRLLFCDQDETSLLHAPEDRPLMFLSPVESDDGRSRAAANQMLLSKTARIPVHFVDEKRLHSSTQI